MKHNLIWDRVLGTNLFPQSVADAEIAWYLKVQKAYGLPVDSRTDTSLIDWAMWSIAPARDRKDFEALVAPLFRYANETPSRVPLSDWFSTTTARSVGFQARPVVGGIFVRMLEDGSVWRRWADRAASVAGAWAPLPSLPPPMADFDAREVAATAWNESVTWRYTLSQPPEGWAQPDCDDSSWKQGPAVSARRGLAAPSSAPTGTARTSGSGASSTSMPVIFMFEEFLLHLPGLVQIVNTDLNGQALRRQLPGDPRDPVREIVAVHAPNDKWLLS
jgi:hypothetical protein